MMTATFAAFLHHLAAFTLFAALPAELVLLKPELTMTSARSLLRMDAAYGMSATVLLIVGAFRVFSTEKGYVYYFHSIPFIVKIAAFAIVGVLSIYPTRKFLSWRQELGAQRVPVLDAGLRSRLRLIVHIELTLLVVVMFCAAAMARGIGMIGTHP
jgi:putative membrane protein